MPASEVSARHFDRSAEERAIPGILDSARSEAGARVLVVHRDTAPLAADGSLAWRSAGDDVDAVEWAFLGREPGGRALLLAVVEEDAAGAIEAPGGWGALRAHAASLDATDADAFVVGVSLGRWLADAPFCPACGARTEVTTAGWARHCPACGREHFPRTDPAVIVAVRHATDPDLLLLGSNAMWGVDRFSCFAGFVESGESMEETIAREVWEEAGVRVSHVDYHGSQAWPYPRSLMVGFTATAEDGADARPDGEEILVVRWFHRSEIAAGLAGESELQLPGPSSIAHRLISDWCADGR